MSAKFVITAAAASHGHQENHRMSRDRADLHAHALFSFHQQGCSPLYFASLPAACRRRIKKAGKTACVQRVALTRHQSQKIAYAEK